MHACQSQDGSAALGLAAANGFTDCVRLLLEGGADKEARDSVRDHDMDILGQCMWMTSLPQILPFYFVRLCVICGFSSELCSAESVLFRLFWFKKIHNLSGWIEFLLGLESMVNILFAYFVPACCVHCVCRVVWIPF